MSRYVYLSMHEENDEKIEKMMIALSAKTRRDILRLVDEQSYSVSDIAHACGFEDEKYFSRAIKKKFGVSPSTLMH